MKGTIMNPMDKTQFVTTAAVTAALLTVEVIYYRCFIKPRIEMVIAQNSAKENMQNVIDISTRRPYETEESKAKAEKQTEAILNGTAFTDPDFVFVL